MANENEDFERQVRAALAAAERKFRRLLGNKRPVAFEDAIKAVETPPGYDRRRLGQIPQVMAKNGEIVAVGFRSSTSAKHNSGTKRLWQYAEDVK